MKFNYTRNIYGEVQDGSLEKGIVIIRVEKLISRNFYDNELLHSPFFLW